MSKETYGVSIEVHIYLIRVVNQSAMIARHGGLIAHHRALTTRHLSSVVLRGALIARYQASVVHLHPLTELFTKPIWVAIDSHHQDLNDHQFKTVSIPPQIYIGRTTSNLNFLSSMEVLVLKTL